MVNIIYRVALCEDEKILLHEHEKICRDILNNLNIDHEIITFTDSVVFFKKFSGEYDLIILDILMDDLDGMELARRIRKKDKNVAIIFITSSKAYALQGYDVNALHYLLKPLNRKVLERLIDSDYNNLVNNDYFVFDSAAGKYHAAIQDIIYLETAGRQVTITLTENMIYYAGKLSDLLTMLPSDRIIRCHQSFAVNMLNIRELTRSHALTINGIEIPVSRTYLNDVRKAFLRRLHES